MKPLKTAVAVLSLILMFPLKAAAKEVKGLASWYGKNHQGKRMANGHPFDKDKLTAASKTLPLGTKVRVTCLKTGKSVWVTITDRGPFVGRRIMDLSEAAARAIGLRPYGVAMVKVN